MKLAAGDPDMEAKAMIDRCRSVGGEHDTTVAAFDARYVAGIDHLTAALRHARRAKDRSQSIADDFAIELLLYAAGTRQIDRAIEMGPRDDGAVVVMAVGESEAAAIEALPASLTPTTSPERHRTPDRIRAFHGITRLERSVTDAPLEALVVERVALLAVNR